MITETIGSFLPDEKLIKARQEYESGHISRNRLTELENEAVRDIVERQIACGLTYITSGELRRKHWANDFWFGLDGISCQRIDSGRVYQPIEASTDHVFAAGRIAHNPRHPFFSDFSFLSEAVGGRALCRQTLPSPANLLLEILGLTEGRAVSSDRPDGQLVGDIAGAYRQTALQLYDLGCRSLQFDDTACGLMCDDNFTKRLLQGGVDLLKLHELIINVLNASVERLPDGLETSVYLSGGDTVVPEWEFIEYPDNIMPKVLSALDVSKFFLPFDYGNDYAVEVLRHIRGGKKVVLGIVDAHSPFPEDNAPLEQLISTAAHHIDPSLLAVSPRTGFKLSSYSYRGLTYEDQWQKLSRLSAIAASY